MPTIKTVNALSSLAGGIAGGLGQARSQKQDEQALALRARQAAVEEADNARRLAIAEQDQAMQADATKRAQAAQDATQQAFAIGAGNVPAPFKSRTDAMQSVLPKVDPRFANEIASFARSRDLADHTVAQIQNDLSNGLFDDVQAGPDGKEQRVPNPERQQSVSMILNDLNSGADPERALQRLAELRAPIIGQRIQAENKVRTITSAQKQLENAWTQGVDIGEATSLFHHMSNEIDPKEWLRDPLNRAQWDAALKGYALVPDSEGKPTMVHPDDRDRFVRMVYDAKQAKAEADHWKNALTQAQVAYAQERPAIEREKIDATREKTQAASDAKAQTAADKAAAAENKDVMTFAQAEEQYLAESNGKDYGTFHKRRRIREIMDEAKASVHASGTGGNPPSPLQSLPSEVLKLGQFKAQDFYVKVRKVPPDQRDEFLKKWLEENQ